MKKSTKQLLEENRQNAIDRFVSYTQDMTDDEFKEACEEFKYSFVSMGVDMAEITGRLVNVVLPSKEEADARRRKRVDNMLKNKEAYFAKLDASLEEHKKFLEECYMGLTLTNAKSILSGNRDEKN